MKITENISEGLFLATVSEKEINVILGYDIGSVSIGQEIHPMSAREKILNLKTMIDNMINEYDERYQVEDESLRETQLIPAIVDIENRHENLFDLV